MLDFYFFICLLVSKGEIRQSLVLLNTAFLITNKVLVTW